ncbi:MAG: hypothetical protein Ta2A_22120 [Treponemataceae bacterium]|nr:MAG: hypothetical protein Ta2A_22120 [Treponemataceae bacterium]
MKKISAFIFFCAFMSHNSTHAEVFVFESSAHAASVALENSKSIKLQDLSAVLNAKSAAANIQDFLPVFSFSFSENVSAAQNLPDSRSKSIQLSARQKVFSGGKSRLNYELSRANAAYALLEQKNAKRSIEIQIAELFEKCVFQKQKIAIQERLLAKSAQEKLVLEKQLELGLVLKSDREEFLLSVQKIEQSLHVMQNELEGFLIALRSVAGFSEDIEVAVADNVSDNFCYAQYNFMNIEKHEKSISRIISRIIVQKSNAIKQRQVNYAIQKRISDFARKTFLPDVSVEGSMSFSGATFPLAEPAFSLKCNISFDNPVLPLTISQGISAKNSKLSGMQDSFSGSLQPAFNALYDAHLQNVSLAQTAIANKDAEIKIQQDAERLIFEHDNEIKNLEMRITSYELEKKRLEILELKLKQGNARLIDALNACIALSESEISIAENLYKIKLCEHAIEVQLEIPFDTLGDFVFENIQEDTL